MNARWTQRNPRWTWLTVVAILLTADQLSKSLFSTTLERGEVATVTDWFNFVHVINTGAAFSFLADAGGLQRWLFIGVGVLVIGFVAVVGLSRNAEPLDRWAGAFVVGGGAGNLFDRIQIGGVVDFLNFHWRDIHWPAFNLADIFLVCAVMVWCIASMRAPPRQPIQRTPKELRS